MSSSSLRALEFQLDQVKSQLATSPNNAGLKVMAEKLAKLIEMSKEEPVETFTVPTEKKLGLADSAKKSNTSHANSAEKTIKFAVGHICEAKDEEEGGWREALVHSVALDRLSCKVIFEGDSRVQQCTYEMIRSLRPSPMTASSETPKEFKPIVPHPPPPPQASKTAPSTGPVRRKHTKAEHDQKKEAEQATKQQHWQSFKQKLGGGRAPSGPFSRPDPK